MILFMFIFVLAACAAYAYTLDWRISAGVGAACGFGASVVLPVLWRSHKRAKLEREDARLMAKQRAELIEYREGLYGKGLPIARVPDSRIERFLKSEEASCPRFILKSKLFSTDEVTDFRFKKGGDDFFFDAFRVSFKPRHKDSRIHYLGDVITILTDTNIYFLGSGRKYISIYCDDMMELVCDVKGVHIRTRLDDYSFTADNPQICYHQLQYMTDLHKILCGLRKHESKKLISSEQYERLVMLGECPDISMKATDADKLITFAEAKKCDGHE